MIETKITRMLGIKYPIIGGTMMWISDADFVAAISNAGGLGIMASAMYDSREAFAQAVDRVRELTEKPFAVNINLDHFHLNNVSSLNHIAGIFHKLIRQRRDMNKAILMHTNIHKGAKIGDVGN